MFTHPMSARDELIVTLRLNYLFSGIPEEDLQEVVVMAHWREVEEGELLFRAGQACESIFLVKAGLIKLYVIGPQDKQKVIEFIQPGDSFAEAAMFSGQGYPVNAVAMTHSRLVAVDAFGLSRFLHEHAAVGWKMMAQMSRRLHELIGQIRAVSLYNAEQRLAHFLIQNHDTDNPSAAISGMPARYAELARALNMTPETLCRTLGRFKQAGWVRSDGTTVFVVDPAALADVMASGHSN
jgi:CRP-like cAMP-binding protein